MVTIGMWEGRSPEQKRELIRAVTSAICSVIRCPPEAVEIIIHEVPKVNWGLGGKPASERVP